MLNVKFHENPSIRSLDDTCGRTDKQRGTQDEANSRFLQFCERA